MPEHPLKDQIAAQRKRNEAALGRAHKVGRSKAEKSNAALDRIELRMSGKPGRPSEGSPPQGPGVIQRVINSFKLDPVRTAGKTPKKKPKSGDAAAARRKPVEDITGVGPKITDPLEAVRRAAKPR